MEETDYLRLDSGISPAEQARIREQVEALGLAGIIKFFRSHRRNKQSTWRFVRIYFPTSFREFTVAWEACDE